MQQTPLSANTNAPASNVYVLDTSFTAAQVNPADVVPTPVVLLNSEFKVRSELSNMTLGLTGQSGEIRLLQNVKIVTNLFNYEKVS